MIELGTIRQNDVGTLVELVITERGVPLSLAGALEAKLTIRKPDGTDLVIDPGDRSLIVAGTGGELHYTIDDGDVDQEGDYYLQGIAVFSSGDFASEEAHLVVTRRL